MAPEAEWDEMIQLVVLWGAGVSVHEVAFDGLRDLARRAHGCRVPTLADRALNRGLGHVAVDGAGDRSPRMILGRGRRQDQGGAEERDEPAHVDGAARGVRDHRRASRCWTWRPSPRGFTGFVSGV